MAWCRQCRTEYDPGIKTCIDCGAQLVPVLPPEFAAEAPVVVLHAASLTEAEIAQATLKAEGIESYVHHPAVYVWNVDTSAQEPLEREVVVAAYDEAAARAVLQQRAPSVDDLSRLAEQSPPPSEE